MSGPSDDELNEFRRWKASQGETAPVNALVFSGNQQVAAKTKKRRVRTAVIAAGSILAIAAAAIALYAAPLSANSRLVADVERQIDDLGPISLASQGEVRDVARAFDALTPELQDRVANSSTLAAATTKIGQLLDEVGSAQASIDAWSQSEQDCDLAVSAETLITALDADQRALTTGAPEAQTAASDCREADAQAAAEAERKAQAAEEKRKHNLLRIGGGWWTDSYSDPDEGCDYFVTPKFQNLSKRNFKYVTFNVSFQNTVDDVIEDVDGLSSHDLRITGPIKAGKTYKETNYGFNLNYGCGEPDGLFVNSATIEYTDGTRETIDWAYMRCTKAWNKNCDG